MSENTFSSIKNKMTGSSVSRAGNVLIGIAATGLVLGGSFLAVRKIAQLEATKVVNQINMKSQRPYVEVFSDEVFAKAPSTSEFTKVDDGDTIEVGSVVKTSPTGRAQIVFPNGTVTRIDYSSEVTLSEYDFAPFTVKIAISKGRIWSAITKLLGSETYQTQSDTVVASVRGTSYGHDITKGINTLQVAKGTVEGVCLNQKQKAMVEAGNEASFDCNLPTTNVVHRMDVNQQGTWFNFNSNQDEKLKKKLEEKDYTENVLGTSAPSTSAPTNKNNGPKAKLTPSPTPSPTEKPGNGGANNSKPTSTPTPTPAPSPTLDPDCILPNGNIRKWARCQI